MAAAFVYGFVSHFVRAGPDNGVFSSDPWTAVFVATAS
jgi:hypothetical protein